MGYNDKIYSMVNRKGYGVNMAVFYLKILMLVFAAVILDALLLGRCISATVKYSNGSQLSAAVKTVYTHPYAGEQINGRYYDEC